MGEPSSTLDKRVFTVREANARLPLVRAITADLVNLAREVIERRQRLMGLSRASDSKEHCPYQQERAQIEEELEKDSQRVVAYVEELRELGVEPKSVTEGLVDFPAMFNGRSVFLCWKLGEPEVGFWHEIDAGFRGRRPIADLANESQRSVADTVPLNRPAAKPSC
jgi:hypothetical protein